MKKITKDYFEKNTSKKRNQITLAVDELEVEEGLEVKRFEYKAKSRFNVWLSNCFREPYTNKKFKISKLKDNSGWAILRIK